MYPHLVNGTINALGAVGQFFYLSTIKFKSWVWYFMFSVRMIELTLKVYWDVWEDAGQLKGGTGCKQYREEKSKWAFGRFVRRPTMIPFNVHILYLIFNVLGRFRLIVDAILPNKK